MSAVMERLAQAGRAAAGAVAAARRRRADRNAQAICPTDSWAFTPLYTDGVCPLCGWAPQGYTHVAPPLTRYERYWGAMAAIAAVSVVMCAAVVVAATRG